MKKRIKTRRLTNIYYSDNDDVGDGYNLLSPLSLSLSLSLSLLSSLSLSVPLPLPKTVVSCANFFEHGIWLAFSIGYSQKRDFANITVIIRV